MITDWKTHKKKLMQNPEFVSALEENELEYSIARSLIEARIKKGMTQQEIAKKMKTKQSVISRLENAQTTPSLSFLKRIASVLDLPLRVTFG